MVLIYIEKYPETVFVWTNCFCLVHHCFWNFKWTRCS